MSTFFFKANRKLQIMAENTIYKKINIFNIILPNKLRYHNVRINII